MFGLRLQDLRFRVHDGVSYRVLPAQAYSEVEVAPGLASGTFSG